MFREGPGGFTGGLSAGKYMAITGAPSATATHDFGDLAEKGALVRMGERKAIRDHLPVPARATPHITINAASMPIVYEEDPRLNLGGS